MAGFTLEDRPEGCLARAPHLDRGVLLGDALDLGATGRFRLLGRLGEMVHIAGKRTSLGALNAAAVETPGIADAVVIRRRTEGDDELSVLAVRCPSASLSEAECRAALGRQLRRHVDPVFVPRRIRFVGSLPRGATGKIAARDMARLEALVAPDA
jgi:acyl-coenzyme A synthetase/AMP-(fatty) acid ligase